MYALYFHLINCRDLQNTLLCISNHEIQMNTSILGKLSATLLPDFYCYFSLLICMGKQIDTENSATQPHSTMPGSKLDKVQRQIQFLL